jgi:hypothetical protein
MKNDRIIPGVILVLVGLVILFDNLGYIDFDWGDLWHLWPLFLIVGGVNLVFAHTRSPLASVLKIVVVVLGFMFVLGRYGAFGPRFDMGHSYSWHHRDRDNDDSDNDDSDHDNSDTTTSNDNDDNDTTDSKGVVKIESDHSFIAPYTNDAKTAELNINGGASEYTLSDTTNQLFAANTEEHWGKYDFWHHNDGSNYVVNFEMKDKNIHWSGKHEHSNKAVFKLNLNPIWDINIDAAATSVNFDLSKFKIHQLKIDGGAASFDVKLGEPLETTTIKVSSGAASNDISIPKDAACKIESSTIFASTNFEEEGLKKDGSGDYVTPGFANAKNKIYITLDGIAGSFDVHRY